MLSASELHRRGRDVSNAGRHGQARRLFLTALDRDPGDELRARILLSLGYVQFELRSTDEALELCRRALSVAGTSRQTRGLIESQLGVIHTSAGNGDEALASFDRALSLLDDSAEPQATALLNRSFVHLQRSDVKRARADSEAARHRAAEAGLDILRAKAEHNVGYTALLAGELTTALRAMDAARPVLAGLSPTYRAVCSQDRAEVLVAAGMVTEAEDALREAAQAYGSRGLRQRQAEAELALAKMLVAQEPRQAWRIARQAARRFRRRGSESWALRADLVAVSSAAATDRPLDAESGAERLSSALAQHGLSREAKVAALHAARLGLRAGDGEEARRQLDQARLSADEPLSTRLLAAEVRAVLARRQGRRADAVRHLRRGLADLHDWQSSFGSLDLQSSLVGHGRGLALEGLSLALEDARPAVVFEWSERARALAGRVLPVRPPSDPAAADDLAELRRLHIEITSAELSGVVPRSLQTHANRLQQQIRQRAWYGEGSGLVTEPERLDGVVEALNRADGALLSYLVVEGNVFCLVISGRTPKLVSLGSFADVRTFLDGMQADLDMAAAKLPAAMAAAIKASLAQRLDLLSQLLVAPVRHELGDSPVVVVPSGSLAGVPWSLLTGLAGRPLTVPRSATSWLEDRSRLRRAAMAGFVAGPRVPRAEEEITNSCRAWADGRSLVGQEATCRGVRELASNVDVLHVVAHGRHSAGNPLFSGLELADGPWFGYDIDQLVDIPATVILSACEVGRSSVRWGEETIGMTVAWLHAGARCVIASPALVSDDAACELLAAAHARLAAGAAPAEALASASREVDTAAPTPFMCFGSGW